MLLSVNGDKTRSMKNSNPMLYTIQPASPSQVGTALSMLSPSAVAKQSKNKPYTGPSNHFSVNGIGYGGKHIKNVPDDALTVDTIIEKKPKPSVVRKWLKKWIEDNEL